MIPGNEDGKIGFLITLAALLVLVATFAMMALSGESDTLLAVMVGSGLVALVGHFMLDGGRFRKNMLAEKKKKKDQRK